MGQVFDFITPALTRLRRRSEAYKALVASLGKTPEFMREDLADLIFAELWRRGFKIVPKGENDG